MSDLLLELFSEEIPARMQARAAADLKKGITDWLGEAGLSFETAQTFVTPRRLTLHITGVPARSPDVSEERKGPRVGAPEKAIDGFMRGAGLSSIEEAEVVEDPKKGSFYLAKITKEGRDAEAIIGDAVAHVVETFPWPKSMRWGSGSLNWVRPLHSVLCLFGGANAAGQVVPVAVNGLTSSNTTEGHRFHAPERFPVDHLADYTAKLEAAKVVLDPRRREDVIKHDADKLAAHAGLEVVDDPGLLHEVAGLVEWPVVMMGSFDEAFLAIPDEVIRATIRANQKCFVLRDPKTGDLASKFLLTSNIMPDDGGATIVAGNERVIAARLSDALYFWQTDQADLPDRQELQSSAHTLELDLSKPLDQRAARLDALGVVFHAKLGTQSQRIARIAALSRTIATQIGADPDLAERAAKLAKADLQTEVVGEFPELQGFMGARYAALQGENASVVAAIEDHYKPQGPSDSVPTDSVAVAVALADKLDTLCGFWAIDEKPTGSKDPYALRRAALGVVRIIREHALTLSIATAVEGHLGVTEAQMSDLISFIMDRLKVVLRDEGISHDVVDASISGGSGNILQTAKAAAALSTLLKTDDGKNLKASYDRAANILAAEEKKGTTVALVVEKTLFEHAEEGALLDALTFAKTSASDATQRGDFEAAMQALAVLRMPIDAFFEAVLVNADNEKVRSNRLALLRDVRSEIAAVADLSIVEG
ncbi:MAG: glycine--tRNA ligase subunit beta [Pseudomonadota bacterium]